MKDEVIIYHGSHKIVEAPAYGVGNRENDYGLGFYCTEYIDLAKEWACDHLSGGYANKYSLNTKGLKILDLNSKNFCIVHWISVLLANRKVTLNSEIEEQAQAYILEHFPVDTDNYDIICGYRADDSYFSYARDFLSNTITVQRLIKVMKLGNLGNQIVLKSKLAFSHIKFLGYEEAPQKIHYPLRKKRDELARSAYLTNRSGEILSSDSLLMIDIMRGGIGPDDSRLQ
jgi:uncharacterized protein YozE (UPF0346 family)